MKKTILLFALLAFVLQGALLRAAGLADMEQSWKRPAPRFTLENYIGTLYYLQDAHPQLVRIEKRGESPNGLPVYLMVLTDKRVPDDDKHVILLTGLHCGAERTGTAGLMAFVQWLLSDNAEAQESLRKNVVLVMPIANPEPYFIRESFGNSFNFDTYSAGRGNRINLETLQLKDPQIGPEYIAFCGVEDQYKPDIHVDVHGTGMHFNAYIQPATVGRAGSNSSLVPWDMSLRQAMAAAGAKAGFGILDSGQDSQRLVWGPAMGDKQRSFCEMGQPFYFCAMYGFFRHHTMLNIIESTWTFTVTEPLKELMRLSNKGFSTGPVKDFRVNTIKGGGSTLVIESYGATAAARRVSRSSLWQKQDYFAVGSSYPNSGNYTIGMVAYGKQALAALTGSMKDSGEWGQVSLADLRKNLTPLGYFDLDALDTFLKAAPPNVNRILFSKGTPPADAPEPALDEGLAIRLLLPLEALDILELKLNGHPLKESANDGYQLWREDGFTHVRVNVPPARVRREKLFLVTCAWNARRDIAAEYGWAPPAEVDAWLKTSLARHPEAAADLAKAVQLREYYQSHDKRYPKEIDSAPPAKPAPAPAKPAATQPAAQPAPAALSGDREVIVDQGFEDKEFFSKTSTNGYTLGRGIPVGLWAAFMDASKDYITISSDQAAVGENSLKFRSGEKNPYTTACFFARPLTGSVEVELWANREAGINFGVCLIAKKGDAPNQRPLNVATFDNNHQFAFWNVNENKWNRSGIKCPDDTWVKIRISFNRAANTCTYYAVIDDNTETIGTLTLPEDIGNIIGLEMRPVTPAAGKAYFVDEVKVWEVK